MGHGFEHGVVFHAETWSRKNRAPWHDTLSRLTVLYYHQSSKIDLFFLFHDHDPPLLARAKVSIRCDILLFLMI